MRLLCPDFFDPDSLAERTSDNQRLGDCVAEGRLALMLGMYQKEGLGRERATVERRRRQAVDGTNKLSGGASCMVYNKNISYVFAYFVADHLSYVKRR